MQDNQKPAPPQNISVIIPVFNSGRDAVQAIQSVIDQINIQSLEIVVVDDGSTDGSAEIIRDAYKNSIIPVRIFSIKNGGAANARSYGMHQCTCDFYAFLDSDDTWFPDKLYRQLALFGRAANIGLVGCLTTMGARDATGSVSASEVRFVSLRDQLFRNYFQTSTVIVRRHVVEAVGYFPSDQRHAEEGDFFNRIAAKYTCLLLDGVLVNYSNGKPGFGASGLSANLVAMEKGELRNIHRVYLRGDCGVVMFAVATTFSLLKFGRRILISFTRKRLSAA